MTKEELRKKEEEEVKRQKEIQRIANDTAVVLLAIVAAS